MTATIKTTARQLINAYGSQNAQTNGLRYSGFGRAGIYSPEYGSIFGVEFNATYYWLDTSDGRRNVFEHEIIHIDD